MAVPCSGFADKKLPKAATSAFSEGYFLVNFFSSLSKLAILFLAHVNGGRVGLRELRADTIHPKARRGWVYFNLVCRYLFMLCPSQPSALKGTRLRAKAPTSAVRAGG